MTQPADVTLDRPGLLTPGVQGWPPSACLPGLPADF